MKKRVFSVFILIPTLVLMFGAVPAPLIEANAATPTAPKKQTVPVGTAVIWCGLWSGSSLNVTNSCENIGDTDNNPQPSYRYQVINNEPSQSSDNVTIYTNADGAVSTSPPSYGYKVVNSEPSPSSGNVAVATNDSGSSSSSSSGSASPVNVSRQTVPTGTAIIWCGLWNGSNFNITDSCTNIGNTDNNPQPSYAYQVVNGNNESSSTTSSMSSSSSSTQVNVNGQTVPTATAITWCGLWNGNNFNTTDSCENIGNSSSGQSQSSAQSPPANPPAPMQTTSSSSGPPATGKTYAALGDSVAAGLGLPLPANADSATTACGRSMEGYPNLVAQSMGLSLDNITCSGSTVGDLYSSQDANGAQQQAQLDQAFAHGTPKYMSITSGANDVQWSYFLQQCYAGNCANVENTAGVDALLIALQARLHTALGDIKRKSNGSPPNTVVTGYYQPVSSACVQSGGQLTANDVTWLQAALNSLNQTIMQTVQQYSFAHYVPIDFSGHDACSSDPWVQTLTGAAPFHPTAQGQSEIAKDVEAAF